MPVDHGICRDREGVYFRCETRKLFNRLPGALRSDLALATHDSTFVRDRTRVVLQTFALREHFGFTVDRLLYSLDTLQIGLQAISQFWADDWAGPPKYPPSINISRAKLDVVIAGDSTLQYIAALLDDVGRLLPLASPATRSLAWFESDPKERCEVFASAMQLAKRGKPLAHLCDVFEPLRDPESWWSLAFKRGVGSRQRVVHYTDWTAVAEKLAPDLFVIEEDGWGKPALPPTACLYITRPGEDSAIDFGDRLRVILAGMCEWLDQLNKMVTANWAPDELEAQAPWLARPAPRFRLPIGQSSWYERNLADEDDFYLPLVDP